MKLFKKKELQVGNAKMDISQNVANQISYQRGNIDKQYPSDFTEPEIEAIQKVRPFTMTSIERLVNIYRAIDYLEDNGIDGDIVECGVWKGGSMMMAAIRLMERKSTNRKLLLFDTYEGMSEPTNRDKTFAKESAKELLSKEEKNLELDNIWCYSSYEDVKKNINTTGYDNSRLSFIKGKVENTLPHSEIEQIAMLRLDTDWYESTKHELEVLYDKLVVGGVLIIDDYGHWSGAKDAVDEFIKKRKLPLFLTRIDYTGRLAIKIK